MFEICHPFTFTWRMTHINPEQNKFLIEKNGFSSQARQQDKPLRSSAQMSRMCPLNHPPWVARQYFSRIWSPTHVWVSADCVSETSKQTHTHTNTPCIHLRFYPTVAIRCWAMHSCGQVHVEWPNVNKTVRMEPPGKDCDGGGVLGTSSTWDSDLTVFIKDCATSISANVFNKSSCRFSTNWVSCFSKSNSDKKKGGDKKLEMNLALQQLKCVDWRRNPSSWCV